MDEDQTEAPASPAACGPSYARAWKASPGRVLPSPGLAPGQKKPPLNTTFKIAARRRELRYGSSSSKSSSDLTGLTKRRSAAMPRRRASLSNSQNSSENSLTGGRGRSTMLDHEKVEKSRHARFASCPPEMTTKNEEEASAWALPEYEGNSLRSAAVAAGAAAVSAVAAVAAAPVVCAVAAGVAAVAAVDAARLDIGAATAEKEKAAAEKDAAEKAAAEATESVAGSKSVSASAISTADLGRRSNIYFTGKSTRAASGSKWRNTGATKPIEGRELSNSNLASALKNTTDFSKENFDAFGLEDLRNTDWIKSGASYFEPDVAASGDALEETALYMYENESEWENYALLAAETAVIDVVIPQGPTQVFLPEFGADEFGFDESRYWSASVTGPSPRALRAPALWLDPSAAVVNGIEHDIFLRLPELVKQGTRLNSEDAGRLTRVFQKKHCIGGCLNPTEGLHHKLCPNFVLFGSEKSKKMWKDVYNFKEHAKGCARILDPSAMVADAKNHKVAFNLSFKDNHAMWEEDVMQQSEVNMGGGLLLSESTTKESAAQSEIPLSHTRYSWCSDAPVPLGHTAFSWSSGSLSSGSFQGRDDGIAKSANNDSPRPANCIGGCLNPAEGFHHKLCPNWTRKTWKPPPIKKLTKEESVEKMRAQLALALNRLSSDKEMEASDTGLFLWFSPASASSCSLASTFIGQAAREVGSEITMAFESVFDAKTHSV